MPFTVQWTSVIYDLQNSRNIAGDPENLPVLPVDRWHILQSLLWLMFFEESFDSIKIDSNVSNLTLEAIEASSYFELDRKAFIFTVYL